MFSPSKVRVFCSAVAAAVCFTWQAAAADTVTAPDSAQPAITVADAPEAAVSAAGPADLDAIVQQFESRFPGVEVVAVRPTPIANLFEVQVGLDIVYTDAQVDHVLQGSLIDAHSREDLTAQRLLKLTEVELDSLPLDLAIKQVKGTGERKIAVFEDPNCGYCRQLHQTLEEVDNITVYTLLFPILSPDSVSKARHIWCSDDQAATWKAWMLDREVPAAAECDAPIDEVLELGRKLAVRGTPAIIFADGGRVNGAMPLNSLLERLDEAQAAHDLTGSE